MTETEDFRKCMSGLLAKLSATVDNRIFSHAATEFLCDAELVQ